MFVCAGVPQDARLAETYYSQFDSEFDDLGDDDGADDGEGTLVAIGEGAEGEEVEDLINIMQNALDKSETSKDEFTVLELSIPVHRDCAVYGLYARKFHMLMYMARLYFVVTQ